jgi:hypothetical protein
VTIIFPEMKQKAIDTARQQMEDGGKLNDSQIEQSLDITRKYFLLFVVIFTLFGTLVVGAIASLIGAAVAKKKPVNPLDQMAS